MRALYVSAKAKERVVYSLPKLSSETKNKRAFPFSNTIFYTISGVLIGINSLKDWQGTLGFLFGM